MMRRLALAVPLLTLVAVAGCGAPAAPPGVVTVELDAATPGAWDVGNATDRLLVWAHNTGSGEGEVTWGLASPGGAGLPAGWKATFDPPSVHLKAAGAPREPGPTGWRHGDWQSAMVTLTIPADEPAGMHTVVLSAGDASRTLNVTVHGAGERERVSKVGDRLRVHYEGRFTGTGQVFDQGDIGSREEPLVAGSDGTVQGFSYGLVGLRRGETVTLVLPPFLAYGYDQSDAGLARFNGQQLAFTVRITQFL